MDRAEIPAWLTTSEVTVPLRRKFGESAVSVAGWSCHLLIGGSSQILGVWRVAGNARIGDTLQPCSMILKGWPAPEGGMLPSALDWPHRERDLYSSGLLAHLPGGISAPDHYGEVCLPDGSLWIWLEDVTDESDGVWPVDRYATLARRMGRFSGAYLTGCPFPDSDGLSQRWLRQRVEAAAPAMATFKQSIHHPQVERVYSPHVVDTFMRIWARRDAYCAYLEGFPQTFCHMDAFRRNVFIRKEPDGSEDMLLIDWAFAGKGAVSEELTSLIAASVILMEVPVEEARYLEAEAIESYISGLGDAGWRGDPEMVRTGYGVAAALRYGVGALRLSMSILLEERYHPYVEQVLKHPMDEILANMAAVHAWMADLVPDA
ncbi:MAG TPA: phosphotransferase [Thermomicrobiales bacterium]|nr:phosphotransferase [Thermomicrobiales bacterium]